VKEAEAEANLWPTCSARSRATIYIASTRVHACGARCGKDRVSRQAQTIGVKVPVDTTTVSVLMAKTLDVTAFGTETIVPCTPRRRTSKVAGDLAGWVEDAGLK